MDYGESSNIFEDGILNYAFKPDLIIITVADIELEKVLEIKD